MTSNTSKDFEFKLKKKAGQVENERTLVEKETTLTRCVVNQCPPFIDSK